MNTACAPISRAQVSSAQVSLEARANILKAMAHPSRLLMLQELAGGERCVCDLQKLIGADISTVSKHLALLKKFGLVEDERRGTWVYYRLLCPCLTTFLECIDSVLARHSRSAAAECKTEGAPCAKCR